MALPPSAIIPESITGALLSVPTKGALYRLWVFDPDIQSERTGFETAFRSGVRSEEHTSELQSLMRISYAVFCLKKKNQTIRKIYLNLSRSKDTVTKPK